MTDFVEMMQQHLMQNSTRGAQPTSPGTYPTAPPPRGDAGHSDTAQGMLAKYDMKVRYGVFDITKKDQCEKLETLMTAITLGQKMYRNERWSFDKDGMPVITVAWIDLVPKGAKGTDGHAELGPAGFEDSFEEAANAVSVFPGDPKQK